jgi:hypothetical protein
MATGVAAASASILAMFGDPTVAESVTITRDPEGVFDDVLDEVTGALTPPVSDSTTIYTGGALIAPMTIRSEPHLEGGAGLYPHGFICRLPVTAPVIRIGDRVTVTASPNPSMVGAVYIGDGTPGSGRSVTRKMSIRSLVRGPRR